MTQPKYQFGQSVIVAVKTSDETTDLEFHNEIRMYITRISLESGTDDVYYVYGLSTQMPQPYSSAPPKLFKHEKEIII